MPNKKSAPTLPKGTLLNPPFRTGTQIDTFIDQNTAWWDEWEPYIVPLEVGTYTLEVAEKGPIALAATFGGLDDESFLFRTTTGEIRRLGETMFDPMISRYSVDVGWKFEVKVEMGRNKYDPGSKKLVKVYTAKVLSTG